VGTFSSPFSSFHSWTGVSDEDDTNDWESALSSICEKNRFLDILENFIYFDDGRPRPLKALPASHQYLGVNRAYDAIQRRAILGRRLGLIWHTQGSGTLLTIALLAGKVLRKSPVPLTLLVVSDRVARLEQLISTFSRIGVLWQSARLDRASSRGDLYRLLRTRRPVVFTTIQKFSDDENSIIERDDIIVFADEAHRSQGGRYAESMHRTLPNASFLGFTGSNSLISNSDLTRYIFGDVLSKYSLEDAIRGGAALPLFYEDRTLQLAAESDLYRQSFFDDELNFENATARDERLDQLARDLCEHLANRWEEGKAMLVCTDKIACVRAHDLIQRHWQFEIGRQERVRDRLVAQIIRHQRGLSTEVEFEPLEARLNGAKAKLAWLRSTEICVVISEDAMDMVRFRSLGLDVWPHYQKMKERDLASEYRAAESPLRLVIVCGMWMTGFDMPHLSTLYIDKPMKGQMLMQAIARANRKAPGKNNGLIVDYRGLRSALQELTPEVELSEVPS